MAYATAQIAWEAELFSSNDRRISRDLHIDGIKPPRGLSSPPLFRFRSGLRCRLRLDVECADARVVSPWLRASSSIDRCGSYMDFREHFVGERTFPGECPG